MTTTNDVDDVGDASADDDGDDDVGMLYAPPEHEMQNVRSCFRCQCEHDREEMVSETCECLESAPLCVLKKVPFCQECEHIKAYTTIVDAYAWAFVFVWVCVRHLPRARAHSRAQRSQQQQPVTRNHTPLSARYVLSATVSHVVDRRRSPAVVPRCVYAHEPPGTRAVPVCIFYACRCDWCVNQMSYSSFWLSAASGEISSNGRSCARFGCTPVYRLCVMRTRTLCTKRNTHGRTVNGMGWHLHW